MEMIQITEHFYTLTEAAARLDVNRVTIRRWIQTGKLTAQRVGRVMFIDKSIVETMKYDQEDKTTT